MRAWQRLSRCLGMVEYREATPCILMCEVPMPPWGAFYRAQKLAQREFRANAFSFSYSSRLLTAADSVTRPERLNETNASYLAEKSRDWCLCVWPVFRRMLEEMEYYGRTHSVVDEGFHEVMAHNEWVKAQCGELALQASFGQVAGRRGRKMRICVGADAAYPCGETGRGANEVSVACRRLAQRPEVRPCGRRQAVSCPTVAAVSG